MTTSESARPQTPRIPPLGDDEMNQETSALLEDVRLPNAEAVNIFATLVRHPGLFRRWMPFAGKLLAGKLSARDRELAILRTAWRCQSEYEWGQHVAIGRTAGLTDDEIHRVVEGPDAPGWSDADAAVLRAADELHDDACVGDQTWELLARQYDERQLIELIMLIGHYHLVAFALNSLGVQREPGVVGFEW